ncbi:hypothetical protein [Pseudomonas lini]|uniref:hypothetical protein n=1 Tax=Pseudomonas lini TaxID=163011 RepID=UPI000AABE509|nr:hypothetical protein [Pseudomonas lini]
MGFSPLCDFNLPENGVAVALSHSPLGGGHLGIVFNETGGRLRLLELRWHLDLMVTDLPVESCWIVTSVDIPPTASKQVVAKIRAISRKLPKINYGIDFIAAKGSFQGTVYSAPKGSNGLTCSSFVLEVFRTATIPMIQEDTWCTSEANVSWGNSVCDYLERTHVEAKHVQAVRSDIKGLRLIPFELAAAASLPKEQRPINYDTIQSFALQAQADLNRICQIPA